MESRENSKRKADVELEHVSKKKKTKSGAQLRSKKLTPPDTKQPIALCMLPGDIYDIATVRRVDHSIVATGLVKNLATYDPVTQEITFDLVSSVPVASTIPVTDNDEAPLPPVVEAVEIVLRGQWAQKFFKEEILARNGTIALSFKEAKYENKVNAQTDPRCAYSVSRYWRLLYDRGCEMWVCNELDPGTGEGATPWRHCRIFAEAQAEIVQTEKNKKQRKNSIAVSLTETPAVAASVRNSRQAINVPTASTSHSTKPMPETANHASSSRNLSSLIPQQDDVSATPAPPPPAQPRRTNFTQPDTNLIPHSSIDPFVSHSALRSHSSFVAGNGLLSLRATATAPAPKPPAMSYPPIWTGSWNQQRVNESVKPSASTPYEYTSCSDLRGTSSDRMVSTIGIVINDPGRPKEFSSGCALEIRLVDVSLPLSTNDHLSTCYMGQDKSFFPVAKRGDVFLCRRYKTQASGMRHTKITGFPDKRPFWALWSPPEKLDGPPRLEDIQTVPNLPYETVTPEELTRFEELAAWFREQEGAVKVERGYVQQAGQQTPGQNQHGFIRGSGSGIGSSGSYHARPFRLLQDVPAPNGSTEFFDCVVEIISEMRDFNGSSGPKLEVKVSDYTSNINFPQHWSDVIEGEHQYTFKINFFTSSCPTLLVEDVREKWGTLGNILLINNVRVKFHSHGHLEGHAGYKSNGFGAIVLPQDDPRVLQLLERKQKMLDENEARVKKGNADDSGYDEGEATSAHSPVQEEQYRTLAKITACTARAPYSNRQVTTASGARPALPHAPAPPAPAPIFQKPVPVSNGRSRKLRKLCDLKEPDGPSDREAFFDCNCEIMVNVYEEPGAESQRIHVTDFTLNDMFWQTGLDGYPGGERIQFTMFCWSDDKFAKLKRLKKGDRVFLKNVRVKIDREGSNLEGDIGRKGDFDVRRLKPNEPAFQELETARAKLEEDVEAAENEVVDDDDEDYVEAPSPTYEGVACRNANKPVESNDFFRTRADGVDRDYRLRGRVIEMEPRDLHDALASRCPDCATYLEKEQFCPVCMGYSSEQNLPQEWHFNLLVEVEPNDCNIEQDPVNEAKLLWVSAVQLAGENVFTNGLEPKISNVPALDRLLQPILHNGSSPAPIFDFQIRWVTGVERPIALLTDTALVRDGKGLPWDRE